MTQRIVLENILEAISSDELLIDAFRERLCRYFDPVQTVQNTGVPQDVTSRMENPKLATQMYQSGRKPALAAQTLQSGNTNSQQRAGIKDYPLVSHIRQLGDPELATQMCQSGSKPALAAQTLQSGNTNSQQRAGVNGNALVSQLGI